MREKVNTSEQSPRRYVHFAMGLVERRDFIAAYRRETGRGFIQSMAESTGKTLSYISMLFYGRRPKAELNQAIHAEIIAFERGCVK